MMSLLPDWLDMMMTGMWRVRLSSTSWLQTWRPLLSGRSASLSTRSGELARAASTPSFAVRAGMTPYPLRSRFTLSRRRLTSSSSMTSTIPAAFWRRVIMADLLKQTGHPFPGISPGVSDQDHLRNFSQRAPQQEAIDRHLQRAGEHAGQVKERVRDECQRDDGRRAVPLHPALKALVRLPILDHGLSAETRHIAREFAEGCARSGDDAHPQGRKRLQRPGPEGEGNARGRKDDGRVGENGEQEEARVAVALQLFGLVTDGVDVEGDGDDEDKHACPRQLEADGRLRARRRCSRRGRGRRALGDGRPGLVTHMALSTFSPPTLQPASKNEAQRGRPV